MVLENVLSSSCSSPHRKSSPSFRRQFQREEWETLFHRHRYLLTALVLLTFLCTIYLYFAVTLGGGGSTMGSCSGLLGARKAQCQLQMANKGKLKFL